MPPSLFSESELVRQRILESVALKQALLADASYAETVARTAGAMADALRSGHKILFFGNGGSAADARHLAAEFVGRYLKERAALPALALTVNTSTLTAIGNDYGYDLVFARQFEALGNEGDVAFGISTSGNSPNIINAMQRPLPGAWSPSDLPARAAEDCARR